ncbi:MAG: hypothetical protein RL318_1063 [Fibrobacterota bacterium]
MNPVFRDALNHVTVRIMEEAAFLFSDDLPPADRPDADWQPIGATLRFEGNDQSGSLLVWADVDMVRSLASNMLGLDEDDPASGMHVADALKELLNMILGNVLTEAWGTAPVFHLGIPELLDASEWNPHTAARGLWLSVEGHPVVFWGEA